MTISSWEENCQIKHVIHWRKHTLLINEIYVSNKKECYLHKTHLTIKKTIKYSHEKTLKDKKNHSHRIRTAVPAFKFR